MSDGRRASMRRASERRSAERYVSLIDELKMQARTRAAANGIMRCEPSKAEKTVEWKAALVLCELLGIEP